MNSFCCSWIRCFSLRPFSRVVSFMSFFFSGESMRISLKGWSGGRTGDFSGFSRNDSTAPSNVGKRERYFFAFCDYHLFKFWKKLLWDKHSLIRRCTGYRAKLRQFRVRHSSNWNLQLTVTYEILSYRRCSAGMWKWNRINLKNVKVKFFRGCASFCTLFSYGHFDRICHK